MLELIDSYGESHVHSVNRRDERFALIESLVKRRYGETYGATVEVHAQDFVWLEPHNRQHGEGACAAITSAEHHKLFAEQYLDRPSELVIGQFERKPILRKHIAELGTFAASDPGAGVELFQLLPLLAWQRGFRYAVMTAVLEIRKLMQANGFEFVPIVAARAAALPPEQRTSWGHYYEREPITGYLALEQPAATALISVLRTRFDLGLIQRQLARIDVATSSVRRSVGL